MPTKISILAAEETYDDVHKLVYSTIHKFRKRYGGTFDDLIGPANEMYVLAYLSHDEAKGPFTAWVRFRIWNGLLEQLRQRMIRQRVLKQHGVGAITHYSISDPRYFDLWEFLGELSEDARTVAGLVFEGPPDITLATLERGDATPVNVRAAIKEYLADLGWGLQRIRESFREVRDALN